jgi:hypothetical protein
MQDPIEYAKQIAYSSEIVLRFTLEKAKEYADKPGVYVECGVAAGAQIIAMAAGAPNKTIYAFDSFEGIPLPSNKDDQMPGIKFLSEEEQKALPNPGKQVLESSGATSVTLHSFYSHLAKAFGHDIVLYGFDVPYAGEETKNVIPIKGWFEETLPTFECEPISLLRLDGDLYNSTYVCLKYLYPKVIEGGLVIIDDWALPGCRQAVRDYYRDQIGEDGEEDYIFLDWDMKFITDKNSTVAYWIK